MIWGGDEVVHDDFEGIEMIETNFSCSVCKATALVYHSHTDNTSTDYSHGNKD
jgi:hypothetical protein